MTTVKEQKTQFEYMDSVELFDYALSLLPLLRQYRGSGQRIPEHEEFDLCESYYQKLTGESFPLNY